MKKILLTILILITGVLNAQELEKVYETNLTKRQEYLNFINWSTINQVFIKNKEIVSKDETFENVLTTLTTFKDQGYIEYVAKLSIKADFKDNKYRISINDPIVYLTTLPSAETTASQASLKKIMDKLRMAIRISEQINQKSEWQYSDIVKLRDSKLNEISIAQKDIETSTDKKVIRKAKNLISRNNEDIIFLDELIKNTTEMINVLFEDISKSVNINDDF